jgi:hypothetical protein
MMSLVPRYIVDISQNAERDFKLSQAGGIAYRLAANSKKCGGSGRPLGCLGWAIAPMGDSAMNGVGNAIDTTNPGFALLNRASPCKALLKPVTIVT